MRFVARDYEGLGTIEIVVLLLLIIAMLYEKSQFKSEISQIKISVFSESINFHVTYKKQK